MKTFVAVVISVLVFPVASARAEWHAGPGISYVTKINDVVDLYKANTKAQGKTVTINDPFPVGVAFDVHDQMDSGLRFGFGVGPFLKLKGVTKHFEMPVNGTVGYTFMPAENASPYVKGGIVHHFASGDYYVSSQPGLLVAGGVEVARRSPVNVTIELSYDASKLKLDAIPGGTVNLHTYGAVLSVFVKF